MKYFFCFILSTVTIIAICQGKNNDTTLHGTVIIMAVGTDGIIFASDSRATSYKKYPSYEIDYYIDSVQKIYLINEFPIGFSGLIEFGNKFISDISSEINLNVKMSGYNCIQTFGQFLSYMNGLYSVSRFPLSKENGFFCAGYVNGKAYLMGQFRDESAGRKWDSCCGSTAIADSIIKKYYKYTNCSELAKIVEKSILKYYPVQNHKMVSGGAVTILKIDKANKVTFIKNNFTSRPKGEPKKHYINNHPK